MRGAGGFWGDLWKKTRKYVPRAIGGAAGLLTGAGWRPGWQTGANVSRNILGWGAYNSQAAMVSARQVPIMHSDKETIRFSHREYVADVWSGTVVAGASVFTYDTIPVNAGLPNCFPFLSGLAINFQEYKITGLTFTYLPTSADAMSATNTALGKVLFAFNYNPGALAYMSELQMMNTQWASSCKPSETMTMPVECAKNRTPTNNKYIRHNELPAGQDQRFYDYGQLQIATVGCQATQPLGELWVAYDIELNAPELNSVVGEGIDSYHSHSTADCTSVAHAWFGTSATVEHKSIEMTIGQNTITFPKGTIGMYLIQISWVTGGAGTPEVPLRAVTPTTTKMNELWFKNKTANNIAIGFGTAYGGASTIGLTFAVDIYDPAVSTVVTFTSNIPATDLVVGSTCDLIITQMNPNFT